MQTWWGKMRPSMTKFKSKKVKNWVLFSTRANVSNILKNNYISQTYKNKNIRAGKWLSQKKQLLLFYLLIFRDEVF